MFKHTAEERREGEREKALARDRLSAGLAVSSMTGQKWKLVDLPEMIHEFRRKLKPLA